MKPLEPTVDGHRAYLGLLVMAGWERLPLPVILRAVNHADDAEDQPSVAALTPGVSTWRWW